MAQRYFQILNRVFLEHDLTISEAALGRFMAVEGKMEEEVTEMANKFLPQLHNYLREETMPEENEQLRLRLQKAGHYFANKISEEILSEIKTLDVITDNEGVRDKATDGIKNLIKELATKAACFYNCQTAFNVKQYIKTKLDIALNDRIGHVKTSAPASNNNPTTAPVSMAAKDSAHPELYDRIKTWRNETAAEEEVNVYQVVAVKTIFELVSYLPTTIPNLLKISGLGKVKAEQYGEAILDLIKQYVAEKGIQSDLIPASTRKKKKEVIEKTPTKQITFDLYQAGKSIADIAIERGLAESTIEGHLSFYVGTGELDIHNFMDKETVAEVAAYLRAHPDQPFAETKNYFGDRVSYGELRMVVGFVEQV